MNLSIEQSIAHDIKDADAKIAAEKAAGTFTSLEDFYERHVPRHAGRTRLDGKKDKFSILDTQTAEYRADLGTWGARAVKAEAEARESAGQVASLKDAFAKKTSEYASEVSQLNSRIRVLESQVSRLEATERGTELGALYDMQGRELEATKSRLERSESNVSHMERLCGLRGIDPQEAIPSQGQNASQPGSILEQWLKADAAKRVQLISEHGNALYAEARARGIHVGM